ncbi:MAG: glycosyltransferase [Saprospiraceae bacterium]|jgi:biofilm PGA synthesis N-glycosyltransferase PgaC
MPVLWGILLGCTIVQIFIYGLLFRRFAVYRAGSNQEEASREAEMGVSVIICARDEEENLRQHLHFFLSQRYAPFEIIVVDDGSKDGTLEYLQRLRQGYAQLRVIHLREKTAPGKKAALARGIAESRYEVVLLSDADCRPAGENWISWMVGGLAGRKEIVLGFSPYSPTGGFLNKFVRFEGVYTALQYFSFALAGMPYMGVGRNLLYRKEVFVRAGGFQAHLQKASGDDDLFVNAVASGENTAVALAPGSFVWSKPPDCWRAYFRQKSRHFSTGVDYRLAHKIILGMIALTHALHYALVCFLVFVPGWGVYALLAYLARAVVVLCIYYSVLKRLAALDLWKWVPVLDALLPLFYLLFSPNIFSGRSPEWKRR